ncbi:MAG TPA: hypothetical protein VG796_24040 [Verrucomicrobiales bacterium]|nr:hypothetical protein [Verrucomicrobiales bacterium]
MKFNFLPRRSAALLIGVALLSCLIFGSGAPQRASKAISATPVEEETAVRPGLSANQGSGDAGQRSASTADILAASLRNASSASGEVNGGPANTVESSSRIDELKVAPSAPEVMANSGRATALSGPPQNQSGTVPRVDNRAGLLHYIVGGATHEWIAFQGYVALPPGELKDEMAAFLPTDPTAPAYGDFLNGESVNDQWLDIIGPEYDNEDHAIVPAEAVIQGAYEEDAEGVLDDTIDGVHFWNPDGGHDAGMVLSGTPYPSALQEAQEDTFAKALAAYPDRKAEAYYWLGRTAHLLADMSVPAHAHLDEHAAISLDDEQFEKIVAGSYKDVTAASPNAQIPVSFPFSVPEGYPAGYDPTLSKLFYNLAKTSKQYDSDGSNGTSAEFGMGKYRSARNELEEGKVVARVEYWDSIAGVPSEKRRDMVQKVDYDIQTIGEYRIYYYESFYNDINSTSRLVRVFYTDGSDESFFNLDETAGDVFDEPLENIYKPTLVANAIGYTAALYQLFWERTHTGVPPDPGFNITAVRRITTPAGPATEFTFFGKSGASYRVERSTSLAPLSWIDTGVSTTGNDAELTLSVPDSGENRQFFRVVKL